MTKPPKIIFITGTDTGVGKTVVTALLLRHLRVRGVHALAVKPFCSGGRGDTNLLHRVQDAELTHIQISPFSFEKPVAPLLAARAEKRVISLPEAIAHVRAIAQKCDCLLVEGAGGLLVPLGEGFNVLDFGRKLTSDFVIVAANRLGAINHTLLTIKVLQATLPARPTIRIVLSELASAGTLQRANLALLQELLDRPTLMRLPFLGKQASTCARIRNAEERLREKLAGLLA